VDRDEERFVEAMGRYLAGYGLPRMAGRMWAVLLICEPPELTAGEIADALHASRGAISGAARLLTTVGLITRSSRRGDRREYFSVPPGSSIRLLESGGTAYQGIVDIADQGLRLLEGRPGSDRVRLEEIRDVYAFFVREFPKLMARFRDERRTGRVEA
jgi:hypothetical protein